MKEKLFKETDYISLAEYAWAFHKKNNLDMDTANAMKVAAFNLSNKKTREKKNIKTPLLRAISWHKIWGEHYAD